MIKDMPNNILKFDINRKALIPGCVLDKFYRVVTKYDGEKDCFFIDKRYLNEDIIVVKYNLFDKKIIREYAIDLIYQNLPNTIALNVLSPKNNSSRVIVNYFEVNFLSKRLLSRPNLNFLAKQQLQIPFITFAERERLFYMPRNLKDYFSV